MWKQFVEAIKQILFLTRQTEQNREEIKELRRQVREMASALERLAYEVHRLSEKVDYASRNEAQEREKLELRLENRLLKFERQLPSGKKGKEPRSSHGAE
ncbi:MAG: hypothetical protein M3371_04965 [Acidobacteriota bacterium]|nr:hypothetical protein [Acidobacteriota bacterium]